MLSEEETARAKDDNPSRSTENPGSNKSNGSDVVDDDSGLLTKRIRIDGISGGGTSQESSNGDIQEHKNGSVEENDTNPGDFKSKSVDKSTEVTAEIAVGDIDFTDRRLIQILEKEVNSLDCLLMTKELEWNAILRLKKLKELLLEQLRRENDISNLLNQSEKTDLKSLLKSSIIEYKNISLIDTHTKSSTNKVKNETVKVELEIAENSGRKYRNNRKEDPLQLDQRNASMALQKLCEKNSANSFASPMNTMDTKQGPKGPIVHVTSLIADYRAKRKYEASTGRKQKMVKNTTPPTQISYSDVLVSLAKISSNDNKTPDLVSNIAVIPTAVKGNVRTGVTSSFGSTPGTGKSNLNLTLAKLLSVPGTSTNTVHRAEENQSAVEIKHPNSSVSETNISLSNLLASNSNVKNRNDQSHKAEAIPLCQGCNTTQAQFVCAGCGSQWYCSRECQVDAWDDHAESCSG